jgi:succinate dehydrogenase/fumarate reductase flavoprotein subunit
VDGDPIARLYAAGEFGSVYGMLYPSGGGNIAECIAFGRIAGEHAAREEPGR